jgi:hypothetical protein
MADMFLTLSPELLHVKSPDLPEMFLWLYRGHEEELLLFKGIRNPRWPL